MDKDLVSIDDPRDAFMLMLLERIGVLESRLNTFEAKVMEVEARERNFEVGENSSCSNKAITSTFVLTIKNIHNLQTSVLDSVKSDCETIISLLISCFGIESILTCSAIIEQWSFGDMPCLDVYIKVNMKRDCFVDKIVHKVSELMFPRRVVIDIEKGVKRYNSHVQHDDHGIVFNAYDLSGNKSETPVWNNWTNTCEIYKNPNQ